MWLRILKSRLEAETLTDSTAPVAEAIRYIDTELIPHQHHGEEAEIGRTYCEVHNDAAAAFNRLLDGLGFATFGLGFLAQLGIDYLPESVPMGSEFPEWVEVDDAAADPAVLEGEVVGVAEMAAGNFTEEELPHVSHDDFPASHYTHDYNCAVRPDVTDDGRYTNLIGWRTAYGKDPCERDRRQLEQLILQRAEALQELGGRPHRDPHIPRRIDDGTDDGTNGTPTLTQQEYDDAVAIIDATYDPRINRLKAKLNSPQCIVPSWPVRDDAIGIEWETGLAAGNKGNLCAAKNRKGESAGFFSSGHTRMGTLWNWPTIGDRVHIEGLWVWDRSHRIETEIHPARFIVTTRRLPDMLYLPQGIDVPARQVLATRVDIYGSGDGGALCNNRGVEPYARKVPMSDYDYAFRVQHKIPRPDQTSRLRWYIETRPGNTFPGEPQVDEGPDGVDVTVPWHTANVADEAVCAKTLWLYWDQATDGLGASRDYLSGTTALRITLDSVIARYSSQSAKEYFLANDEARGAFRLFVDIGGQWVFLNDLFGSDDILAEGLGNTTDGRKWDIGRSFTVYVPSQMPDNRPPGYRVHAYGWRAGGVDRIQGHLLNPYSTCDEIGKWANAELLTLSTLTAGAEDQPLGAVNEFYGPQNGNFGLSPASHSDDSHSDPAAQWDPTQRKWVPVKWSNRGLWDVVLNRQFTLNYHIEKLPFPG